MDLCQILNKIYVPSSLGTSRCPNSYAVTWMVKDKDGELNLLGRLAKRVVKIFRQ
jgi:hypothetical protein